MPPPKMIDLPTHDVDLPAYLARPEGDGPFPGVVVIHEINGLDDNAKEKARRFAEGGYVALAPDLYKGAGPFCILRTLTSSFTGSGVAYRYLDAAREYLAALPDVRFDRIGVAGFCMGGGFAVFWAAGAGVQAAAPFYGYVPRNGRRLDGICPVVGGWGKRDNWFGSWGDRLVGHLEAGGMAAEDIDVVTYPGVGHGFMNVEGSPPWYSTKWPMYVGYDESAADDSWRRVLAFFEAHLAASPAE